MESPDFEQHSEKSSDDKHTAFVLDQCFDVFRRVCETINNFQRQSDDGPLFKNFNGLSDDLEHALSDLEGLDSRGNHTLDLYAVRLRKHIELLKISLEQREAERAHNEAMKAFVISAIFKVHQTRDQILATISQNPDETSIETLLEEADKLNASLDSSGVFPNKRTGYEDKYKEMRKRIAKLKTGLEFHQERNLSPEDKRSMYRRLGKYLKGIDFSAVLSHWN